ncbi:LLM class flavin-dependent oxidoreductase [Streptomyces sp. NBC_00249]|uniref:LLM class flavin-dependent oxidoreductase n=1 Tax=Streptomyces sp. NBC_00249 TaxID=2975690 RepID=UPI00225BA306|nr:LLM class flavin-dependent oxidoreductase [Streptomyces sp. NBC_00249]MCX5195370.1 LLM class flavin-dependent oxidoreductase [Streptomyces sp. NBC_00249]
MFLGVAIDAAGCHPESRWYPPVELLNPGHHPRLVQEAERGGFDFVTLDDSMALPNGPAAAGGLPDAVTVLAGVAPLTTTIGLVPTVTTTYCEPVHVSRALATLDHISRGRAGWRRRVVTTEAEAAHFGPESPAAPHELRAEEAEFTDVVVKLWDSWEDGAEVREVAAGRFLDRSKLHHIDHAGRHFRIKGPSNVPRPPQGHPVLAVDLGPRSDGVTAHGADMVFVDVRDAWEARARVGAHTRVVAELDVLFDGDHGVSSWDGPAGDGASHRSRFAGSPAELADVLGDMWSSGDVDGFHLRPAFLPATLSRFVAEVVPILRRRSLLRPPRGTSLRERLGLPEKAPNMFSA